MKRFITSDWHLGEDRLEIMMRSCFSSPEEHFNHLLKCHNSVVSPNDLVIVVGDAVNKNKPESLKLIEEFNGEKILIRGNHDEPYSDEELSKYFSLIIKEGDGFELKVKVDDKTIPFWATHYPTQARSDMFNLVGHIHSAWKFQLNSINVGVDCNHFYPHNLDESIPFMYKAVMNYYDDDIWAAYHKSNSQFHGKRGKKGSYFKNE